MMSLRSFFLVLVLSVLLPHISEASGNVRVACQTHAVNVFKPSQALRVSDDELLRTILITEDVEQLRRAMRGVDLNAQRGTTKTTPLALAASVGNLRAVTFLLEQGANLEVRTASDATPLEAAITNGQAGAACMLLRLGGRLPSAAGKSFLLPSIALSEDFEGATAVAAILIAHGYNVNAKMNGDTALHIAAELGNASFVKLLLSNKANNSLRNNRGETAAEVAQRSGQAAIVALIKSVTK